MHGNNPEDVPLDRFRKQKKSGSLDFPENSDNLSAAPLSKS